MPNVEKMSIALTPKWPPPCVRRWRTGNMSAAAKWSARHCGTGSYAAPCIRRNWRNYGTCGRRGSTAALAHLADMQAIKAEARRRFEQANSRKLATRGMHAGNQTDSAGGRRPDRSLAVYRAGQSGAADRLLDEIEEKCSLLADHPQLGPARPDIAEDCRYFPVGSYLILYRIIPDGIEVVRVVQGSRRLENLFP